MIHRDVLMHPGVDWIPGCRSREGDVLRLKALAHE